MPLYGSTLLSLSYLNDERRSYFIDPLSLFNKFSIYVLDKVGDRHRLGCIDTSIESFMN